MGWKLLEMPRSVFSFRYGIFDLDGTLLDSIRHWQRTFANALVNFAKAPGLDQEQVIALYSATSGAPIQTQCADLLARHEVRFTPADLNRLARQVDDEMLTVDLQFFSGAIKLVRDLARAGLHLFVSSASTDQFVRHWLAQGNILHCFTEARGSTAVPKGIAHIDRFARLMCVDRDVFAKQSFFCGDGENDMRIGKQAGCYPIGVFGTISGLSLRNSGAKRIAPCAAELLKDAGR